MRKKLFIFLFICLFLLVGCSKNVEIDGKKVNTSKMMHKVCSRLGSLDDGEVSLTYDLYYTGERLNILMAREAVVSNNQDVLNTYKEAYEGIHAHYEGLEYYEAKVELNGNMVTSIININYDKIDINKLLSIEGEEDNIIENGEAKVGKWIELAKKFGTTCEDVDV